MKSNAGRGGPAYRLRLGTGEEWRLLATEGAGPLVTGLARVMRLSPAEPNGCPRLIFTRATPEAGACGNPPSRLDLRLVEGLPDSGWRMHDLGALRLWNHPASPDVICEARGSADAGQDAIRMWLSIGPIFLRTIAAGGLPIHAALIERDGTGVLLAGPGATGKSTCCRRLPPPWRALCDDESLVLPAAGSSYVVHPFPTWSEYLWRRSDRVWHVERHVPLAAVFFLEQAAADRVVSLGKGHAAARACRSATEVLQRALKGTDRQEHRTLKEAFFVNASRLAHAVPAFTLHVSLTGRFWDEIDRVL